MIQLQYFRKKESEMIVSKTTPQSPKYDSPKAIPYFCFFLTVLLEKITLIYKAVGRCWLFAGSRWLFTLSMIPFHEWQEDLTVYVSCFHPESWICLTGCTCKANRNCFNTKNWRIDLLQKLCFHVFCGLCISAVPGNTLKQALHMCQRHSFILCSQLKPWPELKFHPQKKTLEHILNIWIFMWSIYVSSYQFRKHIKYQKKSIHPHDSAGFVFPFTHPFSKTPSTLGSSASAMSISKKASFGLGLTSPQQVTCTIHQSHQS